jgi:hypothetical protein
MVFSLFYPIRFVTRCYTPLRIGVFLVFPCGLRFLLRELLSPGDDERLVFPGKPVVAHL